MAIDKICILKYHKNWFMFNLFYSNSVLLRKCVQAIFSACLMVVMVGCENTEYSADWDAGNFEEISGGDSVRRVYELVGEPFIVYAYPIPRKYAKPVKVDLSEFPSSIMNYDGLELDLHYSRQIHGHRDYTMYVVSLRQGRVSGKIATVVGD